MKKRIALSPEIPDSEVEFSTLEFMTREGLHPLGPFTEGYGDPASLGVPVDRLERFVAAMSTWDSNCDNRLVLLDNWVKYFFQPMVAGEGMDFGWIDWIPLDHHDRPFVTAISRSIEQMVSKMSTETDPVSQLRCTQWPLAASAISVRVVSGWFPCLADQVNEALGPSPGYNQLVEAFAVFEPLIQSPNVPPFVKEMLTPTIDRYAERYRLYTRLAALTELDPDRLEENFEIVWSRFQGDKMGTDLNAREIDEIIRKGLLRNYSMTFVSLGVKVPVCGVETSAYEIKLGSRNRILVGIQQVNGHRDLLISQNRKIRCLPGTHKTTDYIAHAKKWLLTGAQDSNQVLRISNWDGSLMIDSDATIDQYMDTAFDSTGLYHRPVTNTPAGVQVPTEQPEVSPLVNIVKQVFQSCGCMIPDRNQFVEVYKTIAQKNGCQQLPSEADLKLLTKDTLRNLTPTQLSKLKGHLRAIQTMDLDSVNQPAAAASSEYQNPVQPPSEYQSPVKTSGVARKESRRTQPKCPLERLDPPKFQAKIERHPTCHLPIGFFLVAGVLIVLKIILMRRDQLYTMVPATDDTEFPFRFLNGCSVTTYKNWYHNLNGDHAFSDLTIECESAKSNRNFKNLYRLRNGTLRADQMTMLQTTLFNWHQLSQSDLLLEGADQQIITNTHGETVQFFNWKKWSNSQSTNQSAELVIESTETGHVYRFEHWKRNCSASASIEFAKIKNVSIHGDIHLTFLDWHRIISAQLIFANASYQETRHGHEVMSSDNWESLIRKNTSLDCAQLWIGSA